MKKISFIKNLILGSLCAVLLASCSSTMPVTVTNNTVGVKTGSSSTIALFSGLGRYAVSFVPISLRPQTTPNLYIGIPTNANFGVLEAAANGKISKIGSVDLKITNYVIFTKIEYIVTGE